MADLLHYKPILKAQLLISISNKEIAHNTDLTFLLDNDNLQIGLDLIPDASIEIIEGIGPATQQVFNNHFDVNTIQELAVFEPFIEAQSFLNDEDFYERPSAPPELMPRIHGNIAFIASFQISIVVMKHQVKRLIAVGITKH